jgi:2-haloacid dehalogenase
MNPPTASSTIKALTFDVFGTVVDWRNGIADEGRAFGARHGIDADWVAFADAWRGRYQPAMAEVREGRRPWTILDVLHQENLDAVLAAMDIDGIDEAERDHLNRAWHRLPPWPDVVTGLNRLKSRFILGTLSNGNVSLMVNLAKHSSLPWDVILGAEVAGHYKPDPESYRATARLLGLPPEACVLVAAHNGDLQAASREGFRTAFVKRPTEHGPAQTTDLTADHAFDFVAEDFLDLAEQLGC